MDQFVLQLIHVLVIQMELVHVALDTKAINVMNANQAILIWMEMNLIHSQAAQVNHFKISIGIHNTLSLTKRLSKLISI